MPLGPELAAATDVGYPQTLFAVERLGRIFAEDWCGPRRERRLMDYGDGVLRELAWVDEITGTCFACQDRFDVMVSVAMLYFVAAICCEERELAGKAPLDAAFLLADHDAYRQVAAAICRQAPSVRATDAGAFASKVGRVLAPYNHAGLCDPRRHNMYPFLCTSQ